MSATKRVRVSVAETAPTALCYFSNGVLAEDGEAKVIWKDSSVFVETRHIIASGAPSQQDKTVKYLLGVVDPENRSMQIFPTTVFHMASKVKGEQKYVVSAPVRDASVTAGQAAMAAKKALIGTFGAAKKQQQLMAEERNKVDDAYVQVMAGQLQDHMNTAADMQDVETPSEEDLRPIPPYDRETTDVAAVYPFDSLITPTEVAAMQWHIKPLMDCSADVIDAWRSKNTYPEAILEVLEELYQLQIVGDDRRTRVLALQYIAWLCVFRRVGGGRRGIPVSKAAEKLPDLPEEVRSRMLATFTEIIVTDDEAYHVMSERKRDLLVSYVLVLALCAYGYGPVAVLPWAQLLRITPSKMVVHFRALGCQLGGPSGAKTAMLTAPLTFPRVRRGRAA